MPKPASEIAQLKNIGATIAKRLNEIGVFSKSDLKKLGAVSAFQKIRARYPNKTIPVCYYLYSFEGALRGVHWDDLPQGVKDRLKKKAEA